MEFIDWISIILFGGLVVVILKQVSNDWDSLNLDNIICVLDLETTGFNPKNSEIVEIFVFFTYK